ncbi:hypothetical protein [Micromonospora sp. LOL_024]|uniref:hypothetical protein n=1 Tax=Micromonospora sp. LOL_024 TaxID=3345412 RepID=UPI003A883F1F
MTTTDPGVKPYDANSAWPTTVEEALTVEPVAPDAVTLAEREAKEAAALVDALERRVVDGDDTVTAEQIEQADKLGRFARLRAQHTAKKAAKAQHAAWLRECGQIRAEMEAYAPGLADRLTEKLKVAEQALTDVVAMANDHNTRVADWRRRMVTLGNLEHTNPLVPPASQAHIGYRGSKVIVRRRSLEAVNPKRWVQHLIHSIQFAADPAHNDRIQFPDFRPTRPTGLYDTVRKLDELEPEPDPGLRFFRSKTGGGVIALDEQALAARKKLGGPLIEGQAASYGENPYQRQIDAGELIEISRKEAWGQ